MLTLVRATISIVRKLALVSREWKNGSNSSYNCTPFLHSLLTKGKESPPERFQTMYCKGSIRVATGVPRVTGSFASLFIVIIVLKPQGPLSIPSRCEEGSRP